MRTVTVQFKRHGSDILDLTDEVVALFAVVFAEAPYHEGPEHVAMFRRSFKKEAKKPGFAFIAARVGDDLVGMAYGYTMPPGEWWRGATEEPPPEIKSAPKLTIMEWAVRPDHRGKGIGHRLMDDLLAGRSEPWATLNANPAATARDIYLSWGWRSYGQVKNNLFPDMDVLALPLGNLKS